MTELVAPGDLGPDDRRRDERRLNSRLSDLSLPELRRISLTWLLTAVVVAMFLWMVRDVLIAAVLGVVIAAYLRPLYLWLKKRVSKPIAAAVLALLVVIVPVLGALAYSYSELVDVLGYIASHQAQVADQIDDFVQSAGSDGFIVGSHLVPTGLDEFVDKVVPLLQERGSLRTEYSGSTLRDNLGLPVPGRAPTAAAAS